jgi:O-antigen ligase
MRSKLSIPTVLIFFMFVFEFIMDPVPTKIDFPLLGFLFTYILIWLYSSRYRIVKKAFLLFTILIILYSMILGISLVKGVEVNDIIRGIAPFTLLFTFFPVFILLSNGKLKIKELILLIYFYGLLYSFNNIYLFLHNEFISSTRTFRITSIDQNTISSVPLFLAVLSFYQYLNSKDRTYSIITLLSFLISTLAVLVTLTRSLLISLVLFVIVIWFFQLSKLTVTVIKKMISIIFLMSIGLSIVLTQFSGTSLVLSIQARLMSLLSNDGNVAARLDEYILALNTFRENPILGGGIGVRFSERAGSDVNYVHNSVMYILANMGLTGLILIAISIGIFTYYTYQFKDKITTAFFLSVSAILFFTLFFATYKWISHNLLVGLSIGVFLYRMRVVNGNK